MQYELMLQAGDPLPEELSVVSVLAGMLFQLAIVWGKRLNWMTCFVTRGELKIFRICVLGGSRKGYELGDEVRSFFTLHCSHLDCRALVGEGIAWSGLDCVVIFSTLQKRWCSVVEGFAGVAS